MSRSRTTGSDYHQPAAQHDAIDSHLCRYSLFLDEGKVLRSTASLTASFSPLLFSLPLFRSPRTSKAITDLRANITSLSENIAVRKGGVDVVLKTLTQVLCLADGQHSILSGCRPCCERRQRASHESRRDKGKRLTRTLLPTPPCLRLISAAQQRFLKTWSTSSLLFNDPTFTGQR